MADAISIEETNRIRVSIGLKPLPVPGGPIFKSSRDDSESSSEEDEGSTLESRQAQGYDNWKKRQDEADAKVKREANLAAIKKARDVAKMYSKLEGKGLGEADDDTELDTRTFLLQQKKRQKKIEKERLRKYEEELRERESQQEHTAKDLAGVKVAHEVDEFDGNEQLLVLKDATIEENEEEGDELENVELREKEKLGEKLELKKKMPVYNPMDIDEEDNTLLKQYDEVIDGKKRKRFTLDDQGSLDPRELLRRTVGDKLKAESISLDILKDFPTSDYLEISEIKIRKPKKHKSSRQRVPDAEDIFPVGNITERNDDSMQIDSGSSAPTKRQTNISLVDDDDLQASLAKSRREALKKRKKMKPEDIARQFQEEAAHPEPVPEEEVGLVIDETSEFVANLQRPSTPEPSSKSARAANKRTQPHLDSEPEDEEMPDFHPEDSAQESAQDHPEASNVPADLTITGLDEEATLNKGVGATISLLTQRGLLAKSDGTDRNASFRDRQRFLADKHAREAAADATARAQRERDRASGKFERMSAREREEHARWENRARDQAEARALADAFGKSYRPDVQLRYVDDHGRAMTPKEAFKHLSHQFHGKGSGKLKTEKQLKRIEDEKAAEAKSTLDASQATGLNNALGATTKKNRQAGVRLA